MPDVLESARRSFERHDAYAGEDSEYILDGKTFDSRVVVSESDTGAKSWKPRYTLTVRTPTLASAVEESVGPSLLDGWFETFERRLEDAPGTVRADIELDECSVHSDDGEAIVTLSFTFGNAERAPDVAKTMAEYVEGTYVEGVVPGYTYRSPISDLLDNARQGDAEETGTGTETGTETGTGGGPMPM